MAALFEDYFVSQKDTLTTIRGKIVYQGIEKIGGFMFRSAFYMFIPLVIYYTPFNITYSIFIKLILMATTGYLSWKLLHTFVARFAQSVPIITIDKEKNVITLPLDSFETPIANIKETSIIEEASDQGEKQYKLRFKLNEGETTSGFSFLSFGTAEGVLKEIKS